MSIFKTLLATHHTDVMIPPEWKQPGLLLPWLNYGKLKISPPPPTHISHLSLRQTERKKYTSQSIRCFFSSFSHKENKFPDLNNNFCIETWPIIFFVPNITHHQKKRKNDCVVLISSKHLARYTMFRSEWEVLHPYPYMYRYCKSVIPVPTYSVR